MTENIWEMKRDIIVKNEDSFIRGRGYELYKDDLWMACTLSKTDFLKAQSIKNNAVYLFIF